MNEQQTGMTLKARLTGLLVLMAVVICALGTMAVFNLKHSMLQDRKDKVRNLVESSYRMVQYYEGLAASGKLPEVVAKQQAVNVLNGIRYDQREYFFAFDNNWRYIAHGVKPAMLGKDVMAIKDPTGAVVGQLFDQGDAKWWGQRVCRVCLGQAGF
ncbi:cache domain-containing protein [Paludibacterium denitrificans]|uniref:cache domain-containing protein n=1 Tax=Paludibacterium denitrificans TaxID=2675226 RepID=UPI0024782405|nr:cache domain-containing protein [Paludibacterium denitrificans]